MFTVYSIINLSEIRANKSHDNNVEFLKFLVYLWIATKIKELYQGGVTSFNISTS